jgi:DNA-binding IclR family transcriptional regulator
MTSLEKALHLLVLFAEAPYEYTVPELAEITGMNRTTVYRNIVSLEESALLIKSERGRSDKLGPMAFRLGSIYLQYGSYEESVRSSLENIAKNPANPSPCPQRGKTGSLHLFRGIHQPVKYERQTGEFYP